MEEPASKELAVTMLKNLAELAHYVTNRGIDAFLDEAEFLQLAKVTKVFNQTQFSQAELSHIAKIAGLSQQEFEALWLTYDWQLAYTKRLENEADLNQMNNLQQMFEHIVGMQQGVYYLSKADKAALYWFNEQVDLGENNRLYLLKLASKVGLELAHLLYLRKLVSS